MGHDVCGAMGISAAVCANFVDGVIYSLLVSGQRSEMSATKPAKVYLVFTWYMVHVLSDEFRGEEYLILC